MRYVLLLVFCCGCNLVDSTEIREALDRYETGEITRHEALVEIAGREDFGPEEIGAIVSEAAETIVLDAAEDVAHSAATGALSGLLAGGPAGALAGAVSAGVAEADNQAEDVMVNMGSLAALLLGGSGIGSILKRVKKSKPGSLL